MAPYRKSAEVPGFDWVKRFREHYAGRSIADDFGDSLKSVDAWLPHRVLAELSAAHVPQLFAASEALRKEALRLSYYGLYKKIVDKAIVLVVDQFPGTFDPLDDNLKEQVFGFKIELSGDDVFYGTVYGYLLDPSSATGTFYPGFSFANMLERLVTEDRVLRPELAAILERFDAAYSLHFMESRGT